MGAHRRLIPVLLLAACLDTQGAQAQEITGAGSTLVSPLLQQWSKSYLRANSDAEYQPMSKLFDYEPVGSQAGIMRLKDRAVDFAATEVPLSQEELQAYGIKQFPLVSGAIVVAFNVEGMASGRLQLTGDVVAAIYMGKVGSWDHPAVKELNPALTLPGSPIAVIRRAEGSGTTAVFTRYLADMSPAWLAQVGSGQTVAWPFGVGARGNQGVAEAIKATRNSIGYVDASTATTFGLSSAALTNRAGRFIAPTKTAFASAATEMIAGNTSQDTARLTGSHPDDEYPMVATTYMAIAEEPTNSVARASLSRFLTWAFEHGGQDVDSLGYIRLPETTARAAIASFGSNPPR